MFFYIVRRLITAVAMLFVISLTTFLVFFAAPEDPARLTCAKNCTPEVVEANRRFMGFDKPLPVQYGNFVKGLFVGRDYPDDPVMREKAPDTVAHCSAPCLGYSQVQVKTVNQIIAQTLPITASISIAAFVLWMIAGVVGGVVAALFRGRWPDRLIVGTALVGYSLPSFFVGLLLLTFVAIKWQWLPVPQYVPLTQDPAAWALNLTLPAITLAAVFAATYVRLTRTYMIETMSEDYIRTAKAKGVRRFPIIAKHGLRAALTPIVTAAGVDLGVLLGGAVITEQVFNFQGLGWFAVRSIIAVDLPVIVGIVILASTFVVLANLIVDVLYGVIDPRVRLQ